MSSRTVSILSHTSTFHHCDEAAGNDCESCIYGYFLHVEQVKTGCSDAGVRDIPGARFARRSSIFIIRAFAVYDGKRGDGGR
jgi:hypothetical protein